MQLWLHTHRRLVRRLGYGLLAILTISYLLQLLYPAQRALPFVRVAGQAVGSQTVTDATRNLDAYYAKSRFTIATDTASYQTTLKQLGATAQTGAAVRKAADYPFPLRLVPLAGLYIMATRDVPVYADFAADRLDRFAAKTEQKSHTPARNATIIIADGQAQLQPAIPAKSYPAADTKRTMQTAAYVVGKPIRLAPRTTPAARTDRDVRPLLDTVQKAIQAPPVLRIADRTVKIKGKDLAGWLHFSDDAAGALMVALKQDAVTAYLATAQGDAYVEPGKTVVHTIDDREVSRTVGKAGRGVDPATATNKLLAIVQSGKQQTIALDVVDLPPVVTMQNKQSNTDKPLTDLVNGIALRQGFGVSVMELNGRSSNANGDKQFIAASTYKLYVSYAWFKKVAAGQASWSSTINGQSAEKCFEVMIVNSDNPCAKAFAVAVGGWKAVDDLMKSIGLRHTSLATANLYTTANDLAYFMYRLENGTLLNAVDRDRLISLMKRQVYRSGVPAGTGVPVADKVGFVDGYLNDPAIVYAPKGTYIVVILSYGSSWSAIADAARSIHTFLGN